MDLKTKNRLEELFTAELILQRVYLHLRQSEPTNPYAVFAVAVRHQAVIEERKELRKHERGHNGRRTRKAE